MIRIVSYIFCLACVVWLVLGALSFRQSIRNDVNEAHARMSEFDSGSPGKHGKILNRYYEDIYENLPYMIFPASLVFVGSTILFVVNRKQKPNKGLEGTLNKNKIK